MKAQPLRLAVGGCALALLTGCGILLEPTGGIEATPAPSEPARPTATISSTPVPTATETPIPTATAATTAHCVHQYSVYAVNYPADWYTNLGIEGVDDCSLFGPAPISNPDDPSLIRLLAEPDLGWNDPFSPLTATLEGWSVLIEEESSIGGRRAWVQEMEATGDGAGAAIGSVDLRYSIELPEDWFLKASTRLPPGSIEARETLVQILESVEPPVE